MFSCRNRIGVVLLACLAVGQAPARAEGGPIEIPVLQPLSGSAAFVGATGQQALRIAEKLINAGGGINGRPVHLAVTDDQTNPQVAVQIASTAIAAHAPIILGSSITAMCSAVAPLVKSGPPLYCFSPGIHPPSGSFAFSGSASSDSLMGALVRYFQKTGHARLALLVSTDASGKDGEKGFDDIVASPEFRDSVTVTTKQYFNPADLGVTSQLARIRESRPDALVVWSTGTMFGTVLKGLSQSGYEVPVGTSAGNLSFPLMKQFAAVLPRDLYFGGNQGSARGEGMHLDPRVEAAKRAYYTAFAKEGLVPDNGAEVVWDPTMIAVEALRQKGANATPEALRAAIANLTDYAGISGVYDFRAVPQRGLGPNSPVVSRWDAAAQIFRGVSQPGGIPIAPGGPSTQR